MRIIALIALLLPLAACEPRGQNAGDSIASTITTRTLTKDADATIVGSTEAFTSDPITIPGTDGKPIVIPAGLRMNIPNGTRFRLAAGVEFEQNAMNPWLLGGIIVLVSVIGLIGAAKFCGMKMPTLRRKPTTKKKAAPKRRRKKKSAPKPTEPTP